MEQEVEEEPEEVGEVVEEAPPSEEPVVEKEKKGKSSFRSAPSKNSRNAVIVEMLSGGKVWTVEDFVEEILERKPKTSLREACFDINRKVPFLLALGALVLAGDDGFCLNPKLCVEKEDVD